MKTNAIAAMCVLKAFATVAMLCCVPVGCQKSAPGPTSALRPELSPAELLPPELDLVVRIDLYRMQSRLGRETALALGEQATDQVLSNSHTALAMALPKASKVWIALRPGLPSELTDNVVVLKGRFGDFDPRRAGPGNWVAPRLAGGAFWVYERTKKGERSAPARVYVRGNDLLVFASEAALDSSQRLIEQLRTDPGLEPPETGVVSFAARPQALRKLVLTRSPRAARLLAKATGFTGYLELGTNNVQITLTLVFNRPADSARTAQALELLLKALKEERELRPWLNALRVDVTDRVLWVNLKMSTRALIQSLACPRGETCHE